MSARERAALDSQPGLNATRSTEIRTIPDTALDPPAERKRDYSRLSRAEVASLFALHRAGKTQPEIAQALGCNVSTVCRWLQELGDTTELAKQTLKASAADVADRLVQTKHAPTMLEVLRDLGVSEKKVAAGEKAGGVTVVIGVQATQVALGGESAPAIIQLEPAATVSLDESAT